MIIRKNVEGETSDGTANDKCAVIVGYAAATASGIFGGLCLSPYDFVDDSERGLVYTISVGLGVFISAFVMLFGKYLHDIQLPDMILDHPHAIKWAFLSGIFPGLDFIFLIGALSTLSLGIAIPIVDTGVFFGGLWGIIFFKEIEDRLSITLFFILSAIILFGDILISI